jgi:arabinose-5-phosphate isomerase
MSRLMPDTPTTTDAIALARKVLQTEAAAISALVDRIDHRFERVLDLLHGCPGRVIVTGMGKSGIIAHKLAATLSSTGTAAIFLHAAEAVHGDLGVVQATDVVIAVSYSGETEELLRLLESIRRIGAQLVALTGHPHSTLGQAADITLDCAVTEEACPMNLAPTASTTATLAMGDALAMALLRRKGFRAEHFASLHPGGRIGKRLMRVATAMHAGDALPRVNRQTQMPDVIHEMTSKRLGMTCVLDADGRLEGVVTDGDLRRQMQRGGNLLDLRAEDVMTLRPVTIDGDMLAVEALRMMEERKITSLVVVASSGIVEGVVHLHDLWRTEMI